MADAWADEPETTPAQRAAAIADKAVDEITNQGYHYWCATRVRVRVRRPLLARPAVRCPSACERPHMRALSVLAQCAISARSVPGAAPTHQHRSQFHSQRTRRSASHERSCAVHDTVPKGEGAAPVPVPIALESGAVAVTKPISDISAFRHGWLGLGLGSPPYRHGLVRVRVRVSAFRHGSRSRP
eukprot:scaffold72656_cov60-Phaeocystis_antarctica.AAC.3